MKNRIMRQRRKLDTTPLPTGCHINFSEVGNFRVVNDIPPSWDVKIIDHSHHDKGEYMNEMNRRIKDLELEREEDHEYVNSLEKKLAQSELLVEKLCQNLDMEVNHVPTKY